MKKGLSILLLLGFGVSVSYSQGSGGPTSDPLTLHLRSVPLDFHASPLTQLTESGVAESYWQAMQWARQVNAG